MYSTTQPHSAIRKAAIVISTLDAASAEALLAKMPADAADQVRLMIEELADVPQVEQDEVIREFMSAGGITVADEFDADEFDGVELDPALAVKLRSLDGYEPPVATPEPPQLPAQPPFRLLQQATPEVLARHLERQHPQVIAAVTAHLPPQQAAEVVKRFQPKLQTDVLRRIAELDLADEEALRDIERELESLLSDDLRLARTRQSGLAAVSTILNAAGAQRNELLNNLSEHEGDLAKHLSQAAGLAAEPVRAVTSARPHAKPTTKAGAISSQGTESRRAVTRSAPAEISGPGPKANREVAGVTAELPEAAGPTRNVDFEELSLLGDDDWAVLIRAAEPPMVLLALTGASEQLLRRITRQLSKRESQALHNRLQVTGPLRLSDIEHAQRHVAQLASRLAARGEIHLPERRGFAAAA